MVIWLRLPRGNSQSPFFIVFLNHGHRIPETLKKQAHRVRAGTLTQIEFLEWSDEAG